MDAPTLQLARYLVFAVTIACLLTLAILTTFYGLSGMVRDFDRQDAADRRRRAKRGRGR